MDELTCPGALTGANAASWAARVAALADAPRYDNMTLDERFAVAERHGDVAREAYDAAGGDAASVLGPRRFSAC